MRGLFESLNSEVKTRTLFVEDDLDTAESLTHEAEVLLAALEGLFGNLSLPRTILSGTQLLVQKAEFVEGIRNLFRQAA